MAEGFSAAQANAFLNACLRGVAYVNPAGVFGQLHVGPPGPAGVANVAAMATRQAMTFGLAAALGQVANTTVTSWSPIVTPEDFTHVSLWDLVAGGSFLASGVIVANAVLAGDTFRLPVGGLVVSLTPIAS